MSVKVERDFAVLSPIRPKRAVAVKDAHMVEAVAARLIRGLGSRSLDTIADFYEKAVAIGDRPSVQTWRDIAVATEHLLFVEFEAFSTQSEARPIFEGDRCRARPSRSTRSRRQPAPVRHTPGSASAG